MLLATTAIILPDVSFTVPCNTSSGITKHRLPLVQFGAGRLIPSLETMGLTNGSRRPCAPNALTEGFGFSAVCAVLLEFSVRFREQVLWPVLSPQAFWQSWLGLLRAFLTGATGFTAITAGAFAGGAFLVSAFFVSVFLAAALLRHLWLPQPAWARLLPEFQRADLGFTGAVLVFTVGLPVRWTQFRSLALDQPWEQQRCCSTSSLQFQALP